MSEYLNGFELTHKEMRKEPRIMATVKLYSLYLHSGSWKYKVGTRLYRTFIRVLTFLFNMRTNNFHKKQNLHQKWNLMKILSKQF